MKKIVLFVNNEGRGHLTQALGFADIVRRNGYIVSAVILGTTLNKTVPSYFKDNIGCDIFEIESPQFVKVDDKKIDIFGTIKNTLFNIKRYINSVKKMHSIVDIIDADILVNFYEPLFGLFNINNSRRSISIGHQYYLELNRFDIPNSIDKYLLFLNNYISSYRSERWCLSFVKDFVKDNIIIPPILRDLDISSTNNNGVLSYTCNHGYIKDLPDIEMKCYAKVDMKYDISKRHVVPLSDEFINDMKSCEHYISSAGFESICEAYYLGKKIYVVPIENHYEQLCNSLDAERLGITKRYDKYSDISLHNNIVDNTEFKKWIRSCDSRIVELLK